MARFYHASKRQYICATGHLLLTSFVRMQSRIHDVSFDVSVHLLKIGLRHHRSSLYVCVR